MLAKITRNIINWSTICAPFLLFMLPADFFDNGGETICLFTKFSGYHCPGCGLTRATMHLIHLDFSEAWNYNKISFIAVPALSVLWLKSVYEVQGKQMPGILGKLTSQKR